MAIDYDRLMNWQVPVARHRITARDCILYALGIGLGSDPMDERQLRYVYEDGVCALPSMAAVLAYPGFWQREPGTGLDWVRILHSDQSIEIHQPLPVEADLIGTTRVTGLIDKGADRGALMFQERTITLADGTPLATSTITSFCRGDGGFGGPGGSGPPPAEVPDRPFDLMIDLPTLPQAALIYRLSGDYNPLHAVPDIATAAGFERPILHGLCTFGVAGHAILAAACDYRPDSIRSLRARFTAPVYPGETLRTEIWRVAPDDLRFRTRSLERDKLVLNHGQAILNRPDATGDSTHA